MREFIGLFHGKRKDNGEWIEGNLLAPNYMCDDWCICQHLKLVAIAVDPDTIGECTGLKDKNGKLIFEGDIVRVHGDDLPHWIDDGENREVKYRNGAYTPFDEYDSDCNTFVLAGDCEVIGNIHDNDKLLKGGEG